MKLARARDETVGRGRPSRWGLWLSCAAIVGLAPLAPELLRANPLDIEAGKRIFKIHCSTCHGLQGRGGVGANLTDDVTRHGDGLEDIVNVVTNGVPGKPMYAWKDKLDPLSIRQVAAYVHSLKGTTPTDENAKPFNYMTRRGPLVPGPV